MGAGLHETTGPAPTARPRPVSTFPPPHLALRGRGVPASGAQHLPGPDDARGGAAAASAATRGSPGDASASPATGGPPTSRPRRARPSRE
eukprot:5723775-Pyramimonas_sp.AAC.1